jgi:hypothetical protein
MAAPIALYDFGHAHDLMTFSCRPHLNDHDGGIENEQTDDIFMAVLGLGQLCSAGYPTHHNSLC